MNPEEMKKFRDDMMKLESHQLYAMRVNFNGVAEELATLKRRSDFSKLPAYVQDHILKTYAYYDDAVVIIENILRDREN